MEQARIDWQDGTPRSRRFGDVYFSAEDGAGESRHVFLDGIGAPATWAGRRRFTIIETGFGSGLNFALTWRAWIASAPADAVLHYVSVEGFPMAADDLRRALAAFPEVGDEAAALTALYPPPVPGFHRRHLAGGRVVLTLLFGPVEDMLASLSARADAWYLDGFAPRANPDMWTPALFQHMRRLSAPGARFATFTAAGDVRRGLAEAGFAVGKAPGFGRKRDCLRGELIAKPDPHPAASP